MDLNSFVLKVPKNLHQVQSLLQEEILLSLLLRSRQTHCLHGDTDFHTQQVSLHTSPRQ